MSDIFFAPQNPHAAALSPYVKILYHDCLICLHRRAIHLFGRTIYLFGRTVCQYDYPVRSHRCTDVLPRALLPPHPVSLTVPAIPP